MSRAQTRSARRPPPSRATSPRRRPAPAAVMLGPGEWTVLALVLVERLSLHEAACALEITPAELRRRYERALARLRRAVAPWMTGSPGRESAFPARRAS